MNENSLGLLAIFQTPPELERAVIAATAQGLSHFDAVSPFAIEGLFALDPRERRQHPAGSIFPNLSVIGSLALAGGISGMGIGFGMQWLANGWAYPVNAGGRPNFSWPNFVPITFELAVLFAALALFFGILFLLRLPEPYHPYFHSPHFDLSQERFYLFVSREDPRFDQQGLERALRSEVPGVLFEEVVP